MLIVSLTASICIIQTSFEDWNKHPILTTVERTDGTAAIDSVFPAITICKGNSFQPDNWVLPEIILDFFKFHCENETECHKTEKIQKDFKSVLNKIYQKLTNSVEKSYKEFHLQKWSTNFPQFNLLRTLIEKNYTNIEKLEHFLEKNMFNGSDYKLEKYLQGIPSQTGESNLALRERRNDISDILYHFFQDKYTYFDI